MGVSRRKTTRNGTQVLENKTNLWRSSLLEKIKKKVLNAENQAINTYRIWKVSDNCCCWPRVCLCPVYKQPRRRSLGKPKLSSLVFGTGILPHLQIDSLLFKTAPFFGIDPLSFLLETHGRAAPNQKCPARNFFARSVCACGALQAVSLFRLGATMFQLVGKLFFTRCRCAASQDGPQTYEELFAKLDANKDGKVDVSELRAGLAAMGIKSGKGAAQVGSMKEAAGFKGPMFGSNTV